MPSIKLPRYFSPVILVLASLLFIGCDYKEKCDNAIDDDGNGLMDCSDPACTTSPSCVEICNNGVDDNNNGHIDCQDVRCTQSVYCKDEICDNGIDDNLNGLIDCYENSCKGTPSCVELCDNGKDDDGDGSVDCEDPDCVLAENCQENCFNGVDDDVDGNTDCADSDCSSTNYCKLGCTPQTAYWDSPRDMCVPGELCGEVGTSTGVIIGCKAEGLFTSRPWYASCDDLNQCPFGSLCMEYFGCMPFADEDDDSPEHECPDGGFKTYTMTLEQGQGSLILCSPGDCNPVTQDCGSDELICIAVGAFDTTCLIGGGTSPAGGPCDSATDCTPSNICVSSVCYPFCQLGSNDCGMGTCYSYWVDNHNSTPWGYCD
ncbi:hypothetical protein KKF84_14735 [Myxococcota bacterium]|nr:hypothetical protein [Myxococcota bacterium]MBU1536579.1 hypothetical protein [Myxococcota bacterium]